MRRREAEPVRITTATRSRSSDLAHRERRYIITMGVRTVCFIAAVIALLTGLPHWLSWTLIGGSLILPYVAVVMANAGAAPDPGGPSPFDATHDLLALPVGESEPGSRHR